MYENLSNDIRGIEGDEKVSKLQVFVKNIEKDILEIAGDVLDYSLILRKRLTPFQFELLDSLLCLRLWALNNLFYIHCSDEEVTRFANVNGKLYSLTERMYERARMVNEFIETMPLHEKDDDIMVEAKLRFWEDGASSVLEIEEDEFYNSDFTRMIVLLSIIDSDYKSYDEIERVSLNLNLVFGKLITDDEIQNDMDDGTTWAEGWLRHPKLDHLVVCHAVHDICTHKNFSIPDLLRMNTFEVSVDIKIQQIEDQDGARCFWIQNYTPEQVKAKILAEAQHRPVGMSLGDFVYRRCRVYYETMVDDVPAEFDCRGHDENVIPFMDALLVLE
jgi:hypothetical protein